VKANHILHHHQTSLLLVILFLVFLISSRGGTVCLLGGLLLLLLVLALRPSITSNWAFKNLQDLLVCDFLVCGVLAEIRLWWRTEKCDTVLGNGLKNTISASLVARMERS